MLRIALLIVISTLLLPVGPIAATDDSFGGRVRDALSDVLSRDQRTHGSIVHLGDTNVTVRADDGQTYVVDATAVAARVRESLTLGQPVTIVGKPGTKAYVLIASDIRPDEGGQAVRPLTKTHGVVQSVNGPAVTFRTDQGRLLSVDGSQIRGQQPQLKQGDAMTLVYEEAANRTLVARWFEPDQPVTGTAPGTAEDVRVHGYVVNVNDAAVVLRADDGWTHVVDVSQLGADTGRLELGEGVTITARQKDNGLTATGAMRDRLDPARKGQPSSKRFQKLHGTVQSVSGSTLTLRSDEGRLVPVDVSQIKGYVPKAGANEQIVLVYEPGAPGKPTALWIESDAVQPAAAVGSTRYERVHGSVDSIDGPKFWLRTDDDRWFLVDTTRLDAAARRSVQPGRTLTVVGKVSTQDSNELAAESIRPD